MSEVLRSGADDFISKSHELEVLKARAQLRRQQFEVGYGKISISTRAYGEH